MASGIYGEGSWSRQTRREKEYHVYRVYIDGKRKTFYGKTKKEALDKYKAFISGSRSKKPASLLTISDVAWEMLERKKTQIKPTTYDGYYFEIKYIEKSTIGSLQIASVTIRDLQDYIDYLITEKTYNSIKKHRAVIRMVFGYAKDNGYIKENISLKVKMPNKANVIKKTSAPVFLTTEERIELEHEASRGIHDKCVHYSETTSRAIIFLLHTGLRISELIALTWMDVNFDEKIISINKNAPLVMNHSKDREKKYSVKVTTPKRESSNRKVPLDNTAIEILSYLYEGNKHEKDDLVFPNRNGNMLNRRNVARTLESILTRVSFGKKPSLHDLRHTYASELIRNGINVKKVSQILGHSDISTTLNIYVHIGEDEYDDVRDALN